jgi:hypothetical protein
MRSWRLFRNSGKGPGRLQLAVRIARAAATLPRITIRLHPTTKQCRAMLREFTSRHPRCPLFRRKTIGVGLIDIKAFSDVEDYMKRVSGKNSAAYFSRRAARAGYRFAEIDPNEYANDIFCVNTSLTVRQNLPMESSYLAKIDRYEILPGEQYFGVLKEQSLVAYLHLVTCGEAAVISRILGHGEHLDHGIMYLLVTSLVGDLIGRSSAKYLLYDMMLGASDGLALFKRRLGFESYRVRWIAT